jgi:rRNA maturation protein Nop10
MGEFGWSGGQRIVNSAPSDFSGCEKYQQIRRLVVDRIH